MKKKTTGIIVGALLLAAVGGGLKNYKNTPSESTPTPTVTAEISVTPYDTPAVTEGAETEDTPTLVPTTEPTFMPTPEPTLEPTPEPPAKPSLEPTEIPTPETTPAPTAVPTLEPTPVPTEEPTLAPTPTREPTPSPTPSPAPSKAPTAKPTNKPTITPKAEKKQNTALYEKTIKGIPDYSGKFIINLEKTGFDESEKEYQTLSPLDKLGRCGKAEALLGEDMMPTEPRGEIGSVKPSGWHTVKYSDLIEDLYLYNRCHLIGYQLTGENANPLNLITGTRYFNTEGMEPYESKVANYIQRTGNHVYYRVTPVFDGDALVAKGVWMEALSLEDGGKGVDFSVFVYNIQPGIEIDYLTGDSAREKTPEPTKKPTPTLIPTKAPESKGEAKPYVLNTNTHKIHEVDCSSVSTIKAKNRKDVVAVIDELLNQGYVKCKICDPD